MQVSYGAFNSMGSGAGYNAPVIGGNLPWGSGAPSAAPTSAAGLQANYQQEYQKSLAMNRGNYEQILKGYQETLAAQNAGYQALNERVMGDVNRMESGRRETIGRESAAQHGSAMQSLINRGLGNTTVQEAVAGGIEADKQNRLNELTGTMAGVRAQYGSMLGQNHLQALAGQAQNQFDWLNSVNAGYPDVGMYAAMAQRFGELDAMKNPGGAGAAGAGGYGGAGSMIGGTGGPRLGYVPPTRNWDNPMGSVGAPAATGGWGNIYGGALASDSQLTSTPASPTYGRAVGMVGSNIGNNALSFMGGNMGPSAVSDAARGVLGGAYMTGAGAAAVPSYGGFTGMAMDMFGG